MKEETLEEANKILLLQLENLRKQNTELLLKNNELESKIMTMERNNKLRK